MCLSGRTIRPSDWTASPVSSVEPLDWTTDNKVLVQIHGRDRSDGIDSFGILTFTEESSRDGIVEDLEVPYRRCYTLCRDTEHLITAENGRLQCWELATPEYDKYESEFSHPWQLECQGIHVLIRCDGPPGRWLLFDMRHRTWFRSSHLDEDRGMRNLICFADWTKAFYIGDKIIVFPVNDPKDPFCIVQGTDGHVQIFNFLERYNGVLLRSFKVQLHSIQGKK